jgi:4-hydroxyphenylpyruvate dioxygenase
VKTAIATVCLSGTLEEKLQAIAAARFKGVEIFENDLLSFNGTPTDVRRIIEDLGLVTAVFQPFRDFEGMPEPQRTKVFSRAERKFDVMQELGCDFLMVCSNVSPDSLGGIDRAAADFHELGERAAKRGMRVAFEALAWGRHVNDYRDAWEVVRRANHPAVGLVLDSFHILARETDLTAIRSIPNDRIFLVQMADAPKLDMDYLSWSRHYRCFPGQGDLPIDALWRPCRRQALTACFLLRSSMIASGPDQPAALRSTASARCSLCSISFSDGPTLRCWVCRNFPLGRPVTAWSSSSSPWTSGAPGRLSMF